MELRRAWRSSQPQSMSCPGESTSQSEGRFCDEFSASHSFGNCIPFRMRIPGCTFRLSCHWESMSHSTARFLVAFSAWAAIGNACLTPRCHGAFFTPAPCTEFDSPRYGQEIKRQVDISIYLPVTIGGGAENRTPVHESPLIGISKLSRWFCLGRFARSDTLAAS